VSSRDRDQRSTVLVASARTPVGRFGGALRGLDAADLGAHAVRAVLGQLDGAVTPDHVFLGNVVQAGGGQNPARVAATRGGLSTTVPGTTLNDVCLTSMTSAGLAATLIRSGELDTALVGGFESMSRALHGVAIRQAPTYGDTTTVDLLRRDGLSCSLSLSLRPGDGRAVGPGQSRPEGVPRGPGRLRAGQP